LLILLKCPFGFLQVASNDATFTLRALLLIATIDLVNQPDLNHTQRSLLSALDEIAKAPLPLNRHQQEEEKFAKKSQDQAKTRLEKKERKMERKEKRKQEAHTNAATCEDDFDEHDCNDRQEQTSARASLSDELAVAGVNNFRKVFVFRIQPALMM
jgi:hypothetical protein